MRSKNLALISTFALAILIASGVALYARGYRFNLTSRNIEPNGHLVIKSVPDGAEVFIDGELESATNANLRLSPQTYDVEVRKEGYHTWSKRITIEKEEVTEYTAHLFRAAPSLSAITFAGSINPTPSNDFTKIAYIVPPSEGTNVNATDLNSGLWVMETTNLPIGFSREPRRITDGDLTNATFEWSPNGREILLTTRTGTFLLNSGEFTPQAQRINIISRLEEIKEEWELQENARIESLMLSLPQELSELLSSKVEKVIFSPDEEMVLYSVKEAATLRDRYKDPIPGSSSQQQERQLQQNGVYVYDIEEDRNYKIADINTDDLEECALNTPAIQLSCSSTIAWFPTARHLVVSEPNKIRIIEYDGTNDVQVYAGSYVAPFAFPIANIDRLIALTNLGSDSTTANLYSVGIK